MIVRKAAAIVIVLAMMEHDAAPAWAIPLGTTLAILSVLIVQFGDALSTHL
jgi:hypothetical protein